MKFSKKKYTFKNNNLTVMCKIVKTIVSILVLGLMLTTISCNGEKNKTIKDYVTISGEITNKNSDSLVIVLQNVFKHVIQVANDGTFKDKFAVDKGRYDFFDGKEWGVIFLKNGFDIKITLDTKKFDETLKFSGYGSETSNYISDLHLYQEIEMDNYNWNALYKLEKDDFSKRITEIKADFEKMLNKKGIDSAYVMRDKALNEKFFKELENDYDTKHHKFLNKDNDSTGKKGKLGKEYTSAYICPMYCEGSGSAKEGECPACGMDYVKNKDFKAAIHQH